MFSWSGVPMHQRALASVLYPSAVLRMGLSAALSLLVRLGSAQPADPQPEPVPSESMPSSDVDAGKQGGSSPESERVLGLGGSGQQGPTGAAGKLEQGCDAGRLVDCTDLAERYEKGTGSPPDLPRAAVLYDKACDGGHARGCRGLGRLYEEGLGVERDASRAAVFYQKACNGGDASGCNSLGVLQENGVAGVSDGDGRAATLYEKACNAGDAEGCKNLARVKQESHRKSPIAGLFEIGWANIGFRAEAENRLGIGHGNYFFVGGGAVFYDLLAASVDAGFGPVADHRQFQQVVSNQTSTATASSSITSLYAALSVGVRTPAWLLHWVTLGADVGVVTLGASRGIDNCSNCASKNLHIRDGAFYAFRLALGLPRPESTGTRFLGFGITYRRHLAPSDLDNTLMLSFGAF
jgi:hypothetical protein